ncbi:MAG: hypothetical protein JWO97_3650, partial [Acidobacteria bacterium]|nr:hypothetical protein [Acidobacteriota bacterium]
ALAGDHVDDPEQLMSDVASQKAASFSHYGVLALTNRRHFHPTVVNTYAEYHRDALRLAAEAAAKRTTDRKIAFERALYHETFAAHFLHDAFASGHMAFNRAGSSVAATLTYHDDWNARGRRVADRNGDAWCARGDGHLFDVGGNEAMKDRVVVAAIDSVSEFLRSFIEGTVHDERFDEIIANVPAYYVVGFVVPPDRNDATCTAALMPGETLAALQKLGDPVDVKATVDTWGFLDTASRAFYGDSQRGVMVGGSYGFNQMFEFVRVGRRIIHHRVYAGIGKLRPANDEDRLAYDFGYLFRLGMTNEGLVTYELGLGYSNAFTQYHLTTLRFILGMNLELGKTYLRIQGGPATEWSRGHYRWGSYTTIGVGHVLGAR